MAKRKTNGQEPLAKRQKAQKQSTMMIVRPPSQGLMERPVVTRGFTARLSGSSIVRIKNMELFQSSSIQGAATSPYTVVSSTVISPRYFTWLNIIAANYSRYKFHSIRFIYRPIVGTTTNGQFAMGWFTDPADGNYWSGTTQTLAALSQCRKYSQVPLYESCELKVDKSDFNSDWYYKSNTDSTTSADSRLVNCGSLGWWVTSNATQGTAPVGNLYVEYDCELADPVSGLSNP
jgi:hypothetical protein